MGARQGKTAYFAIAADYDTVSSKAYVDISFLKAGTIVVSWSGRATYNFFRRVGE